MRLRYVTPLLILLLVLVGCRQTAEPTAENVTIDIAVNTETPAVGDATVLVTVLGENDTPVNDATVTVRGDMTHAGMQPVLPDAVTEAEDGVYAIPFEFTMGGDWIIEVEVLLANGETAAATLELDGVEDPGPDDMGDMDMDMDDMDMDDDMGDMHMGAGTSGAYMNITNNGDADVTLISVSAEGIGMTTLHETVVEDDIASMEEMEDGILIPAGETVELAPGGLHVMLMELENDLVEGETVELILTFDDETSITIAAPIVGMASDDTETIEAGDFSISAYWVRPTALGDMDDMDMDMDDDDMDMDAEATEASE